MGDGLPMSETNSNNMAQSDQNKNKSSIKEGFYFHEKSKYTNFIFRDKSGGFNFMKSGPFF